MPLKQTVAGHRALKGYDHPQYIGTTAVTSINQLGLLKLRGMNRSEGCSPCP